MSTWRVTSLFQLGKMLTCRHRSCPTKAPQPLQGNRVSSPLRVLARRRKRIASALWSMCLQHPMPLRHPWRRIPQIDLQNHSPAATISSSRMMFRHYRTRIDAQLHTHSPNPGWLAIAFAGAPSTTTARVAFPSGLRPARGLPLRRES